MAEPSHRDLLALQASGLFVLDARGRILHCNSPDREPGPRLFLLRANDGAVLLLRHDVGDEPARELERLAATEPPLADPTSPPQHLDAYQRTLAAAAPVESVERSLEWTFPQELAFAHPAPLVRSGTPDGDAIVARLERDGMGQLLIDAGFVDTGEFWPPWCIAIDRGQIASIAFTARLAPASAEVGLYTLAPYRGRGLGAAATAGWASHPELAGRTLFYGTSTTNVSSQRVTERLALRFIGTSLAIS